MPIVVELFCGLFGWSEGFVAEGFDCVGFDIVDMGRELGISRPERCNLVLQDILTLHGSQLRDAACIVASPPCQEYSYMAMPWKRAKQISAALRGHGEFPDGYRGSRTVEQLNRLFDACFRLQREASEAAGHHIPLVVENVKGAQPWVGRAAWHFGSFYLWGDVPALMPHTGERISTTSGKGNNPDGRKVPGLDWSKYGQPSYKAEGFNMAAAQRLREGMKGTGGTWFTPQNSPDTRGDWRNSGCVTRLYSSRSDSRKAASALIAKIPFALAQHVAQCFKPEVHR